MKMSIFLYIRDVILAAYHYIYIVEIFVGLVLLAVLLDMYQIVITCTWKCRTLIRMIWDHGLYLFELECMYCGWYSWLVTAGGGGLCGGGGDSIRIPLPVNCLHMPCLCKAKWRCYCIYRDDIRTAYRDQNILSANTMTNKKGG